MIAKGGASLLEREAVSALRDELVPIASMITPNLPEAGVLLDARHAETIKEMRQAAEKLRRLLSDSGERWVFLKGGHLPGNDTIDLLHDGDRLIELPGRRIETRNTHGTGCSLSAALAALLPRTLGDFAAAVINGTYVMDSGMSPKNDSLALESGEGNPYANILAVRTADKDNEALRKLDELLHSDEVRAFIEDTYDGAVIAAF